MKQTLIEMKGISKNFGSIQALNNVDFKIFRGEVVGLVGDNGAGKSTLVKILAGVFLANRGEIYFGGKRVSLSSAKEARAMGIETVHQELSLANIISIWRNFFLRREPTRKTGQSLCLRGRR